MTSTAPRPFNLATAALAPARTERSDHTALRCFDDAMNARELTYRQLDDNARSVAAALLEHGLEKGDRVMLRIPSGLEYAYCALGAPLAGAVLVPSTIQLTDEEAAFIIRDAGTRFLVGPHLDPALTRGTSLRATLEPGSLLGQPREPFVAETVPDDPALLLYTSGTTSEPKGVLHAHRMALGRAPMRRGWTGIGPSDVVLHAGALNWTYAFGISLIDSLSVGATTTLYTGTKRPERWPELIESSNATIFAAVPTIYRQILKYCPDDAPRLASLRHALCAGEPLPAALYHAWREFAGVELYEALGMTECSTYISSGPATPPRPGSPGRPQPGRRVAVLPLEGGEEPCPPGAVGLLAVHRSDPGLMLHYWNRPDEDARVTRGEWFVGGDLAAIDDDGYVWFHGRSDDLMNAFGYRVSPVEVEAAISRMPGVADCAVAELQVRDDVSVICAWVVRSDNALTPDDVHSWCETHLAEFKRPREVLFREALPRARNGKLDRRALSTRVQPNL